MQLQGIYIYMYSTRSDTCSLKVYIYIDTMHVAVFTGGVLS